MLLKSNITQRYAVCFPLKMRICEIASLTGVLRLPGAPEVSRKC